MAAFAGNSVLCRLALDKQGMDPDEFTGLRLLSGALVLCPVFFAKMRTPFRIDRKSVFSALALMGYAWLFSLAYLQLGTGLGALILFAAVQLTMIGCSALGGRKISSKEGAGVAFAMGGLIYLLFPGTQEITFLGAGLMLLSGVCWGMYSVLGKAEADPSFATARNFMVLVPVGFYLLYPSLPAIDFKQTGVLLALASGGVTSGLGYLLWYFLLQKITLPTAAVLQLSVPVIAAFGGLVFSGEPLGARLATASLVILGGIFLTISPKPQPQT